MNLEQKLANGRVQTDSRLTNDSITVVSLLHVYVGQYSLNPGGTDVSLAAPGNPPTRFLEIIDMDDGGTVSSSR